MTCPRINSIIHFFFTDRCFSYNHLTFQPFKLSNYTRTWVFDATCYTTYRKTKYLYNIKNVNLGATSSQVP